MAPKNPLENPPAASSSEEEGEEEEGSSGEETDQEERKGEEEDDDDDSPVKKPETAAPVAAKTANNKIEASDSEAESGSGSESDSDSEPERGKNDGVKPLATKLMPESPGSKNPRLNVVGLLAKSAAKRLTTDRRQDGKEPKRAKKTEQVKKSEDEEGKKTGEDTKKQLFQRLFSEDDEIALLQGILEFTASKGDPYDDMDSFCEFVKNSINFNATKAQLFDKIRRLRRKFENSVKKGKNGEGRVFSKAHDKKAFDLWKKIWGSEGALQSAPKSASKSKKNQGANSKATVLAGTDLFAPSNKEGQKKEGEKEVESNCGLARGNNDGVSGRQVASFFKMENVDGFDELTVMQGWDMADGPKRRELEEKWKKIQAAQMELSLQRKDFVSEAGKMIFEALKAHVPGFGH